MAQHASASTLHRPTAMAIVQCQICQKSYKLTAVAPAEFIHPPIVELIQKEQPEWSPQGFICLFDLNHYRSKYFENLVAADKGELSALETEVIQSLKAEEEFISANINTEFAQRRTLGERVADKMAEWGGSWPFIFAFTIVLVGWIAVNTSAALAQPFDPYPYILLNLVLSCLAAIQAPIIMMSQNRQEARDRLQAENDYRVNLKAELEIRHIIAKLDQLVTHQWQRLLEIQRLQFELIEQRVSKPAHDGRE